MPRAREGLARRPRRARRRCTCRPVGRAGRWPRAVDARPRPSSSCTIPTCPWHARATARRPLRGHPPRRRGGDPRAAAGRARARTLGPARRDRRRARGRLPRGRGPPHRGRGDAPGRPGAARRRHDEVHAARRRRPACRARAARLDSDGPLVASVGRSSRARASTCSSTPSPAAPRASPASTSRSPGGRDETSLRRARCGRGRAVRLPRPGVRRRQGGAARGRRRVRPALPVEVGGLEQEGFGIVFVEAAACGTAELAGRSGGSFEAVAHGVTGLVVDQPDSPAAVAAALGTLLADAGRPPPWARRPGAVPCHVRLRRAGTAARTGLGTGVGGRAPRAS